MALGEAQEKGEEVGEWMRVTKLLSAPAFEAAEGRSGTAVLACPLLAEGTGVPFWPESGADEKKRGGGGAQP
jgi:hypothetical protein